MTRLKYFITDRISLLPLFVLLLGISATPGLGCDGTASSTDNLDSPLNEPHDTGTPGPESTDNDADTESDSGSDMDSDTEIGTDGVDTESDSTSDSSVDTETDTDTDSDTDTAPPVLVVNSLLDVDDPPADVLTLRQALRLSTPGTVITFDRTLDGGRIELSLIETPHTSLKGEVMGTRMDSSGPISYLEGYFERDYGPSALYVPHSIDIDASNLPSGITIHWTGGLERPARVLAVNGDLRLNRVTIRGGTSVAIPISEERPDGQPWTLARGGGVAVWGRATLIDCTLYDNHCNGDFAPSRDRGAFGGAVFADGVELRNSVVIGNTVSGGGAAGGGVYSLGGVEATPTESLITGSTISGNRIEGLHAYGAGVYSDGGGIGNSHRIRLENSTLTHNLVTVASSLPASVRTSGYWRGGAFYMSNGEAHMDRCTIVHNEVRGVPRTDSLGRPNLAGAVAATVGNAHAVEDMLIIHSIITGNRIIELNVDDEEISRFDQDIFTGSLMHFFSGGYNLIGTIDFSQMLVPVGQHGWRSLVRKHFPTAGDLQGVTPEDALVLDNGIIRTDHFESAGVAPGEAAVLYYLPGPAARGMVPAAPYAHEYWLGEYEIVPTATDNFLEILLWRLETHFSLEGFADAFTGEFEQFLSEVDLDIEMPGHQPYTDPMGRPILTVSDTGWFGPEIIWPRMSWNHPWIEFWHRLEATLQDPQVAAMGRETLSESDWRALFSDGPLVENPAIVFRWMRHQRTVTPQTTDQIGHERPLSSPGDIGAITAP